MNILIPAAGKGSRFVNSKYVLPKPCINVDKDFMLVRAAKTLGFKGQHIFLLQDNEYRDILAARLYETYPDAKVGVIDYYTEGAAQTALLARELIDNDDELIIANCDQIMEWNTDIALKQLRKFDAGIVTIESRDPKHSYAVIENNLVVDVQEKNVISNQALTGIHYWKHGSDFVRSASKMIEDNIRSGNNEFYIGPTYNNLIKEGKKIGSYLIKPDEIHFVGTPEDLERYESRKTK